MFKPQPMLHFYSWKSHQRVICHTVLKSILYSGNKLVMVTALYETSEYHPGKGLSVQVGSRGQVNNDPFAFFIPHLLTTPKPQ